MNIKNYKLKKNNKCKKNIFLFLLKIIDIKN